MGSGDDGELMERALAMGRRLYRPGTSNATLRVTLREHFRLDREQIDRVLDAIRAERDAR